MMQGLPAGGAMAAVQAAVERVTEAIGADSAAVALAALNAADATVISGETAAVDRVLARLKADDLEVRRLTVSHAFHSGLMDPLLAELERVAGPSDWGRPRIPLVSNFTGAPVTTFRGPSCGGPCRS